ncbi:hypothetical protein, partial [Vibrio cholerae]|uniref:hypothetical protein n=1 Tax=Vibrio cholerae TaxID=666 RepID=UPI001F1652F1
VMGLSTPILGGLKDGFFGPKIMKNGMFLAHPYDPGIDPDFWPKNGPKIMGRTLRENPGPMTRNHQFLAHRLTHFH